MQSSALSLRPSKWSDVIGHADVVESVKELLATKIPVAIGFSGSAGSGKTSLAQIVARAIQPEFDPDQLDILHINAADKNGVDDARALAEDSKYRPTCGKYKVRILDEAHMMTVQAQNTLLLPTEEADAHTLWILCTTDPQKLIPALRSRCLWYDLKPLGPGDVKKLYEVTAKHYGLPFPSELYEEVTRINLTNPRDLLYAFDRYTSGIPAKSAVSGINETEVQYVEIAQAALKGWHVVAPLLSKLKASDAKGLRVVLSSYFRAVLLRSEQRDGNAIASPRPKTQTSALSELLIRLAAQDTFEDSVSFGATCGALYIFCAKCQ